MLINWYLCSPCIFHNAQKSIFLFLGITFFRFSFLPIIIDKLPWREYGFSRKFFIYSCEISHMGNRRRLMGAAIFVNLLLIFSVVISTNETRGKHHFRIVYFNYGILWFVIFMSKVQTWLPIHNYKVNKCNVIEEFLIKLKPRVILASEREIDSLNTDGLEKKSDIGKWNFVPKW